MQWHEYSICKSISRGKLQNIYNHVTILGKKVQWGVFDSINFFLHNELALSDTSCPCTQGYNYQQGGELHIIQQFKKNNFGSYPHVSPIGWRRHIYI